MLLVVDSMPVTTELPALISSSALSVAILQWIKNSNLFTFIRHDTAKTNLFVSWFFAFISAIGIHYQYDPAIGALTVTGLTGAAIVAAAIQSAKSYGFNWLVYNVSGMKEETKVVKAQLVSLTPPPDVKKD